MKLNLNAFHAEIRRGGVHHNNRYRVMIGLPQDLQTGYRFNQTVNDPVDQSTASRLALRCVSATLPGMQIMTKDDIFRYGYGPVDKTASGVLFSDVTCNFVLDDRGDVYDLFTQWQKLAVKADSSAGMLKFSEDEMNRILENDAQEKKAAAESGEILVMAGRQPSKNWQPYEVGYKDSYIGGVEVDMLNVRNKTVTRCILDKAFPLHIGDIQMGHDSNDQASILPVTFSYRDHVTSKYRDDSDTSFY